MSDRKWWPVEWCDEVMPPSRPSPDEWLINANGHVWLGYAPDATDVNEHEKRYFSRPLDHAKTPVEFYYQDRFEDIEISVKRDGSFEIVSGTVAEGANSFWEFDTEALGDSLHDLAKQIAESIDADKESWVGQVSVCRTGTALFELSCEYKPQFRPFFVPAGVRQ